MDGLKVEKNRLYSIGEFDFKNFTELDDNEIRMVLEWRNNLLIRKQMYSKDEISYDSHVSYIERLKLREDRYYWLVYKSNIPFGVIDLVDINETREVAEFGYYMRPDCFNSGEGLNFVYNSIKFFFHLGIKELFSSVNVNNRQAIVVDKYLGCQIKEEEIYELEGDKYYPITLSKEVFEKRFK